MNRKQKLIEQAGFSQTFEADRLNQLIDLTVNQCINAVRNAPQNHCRTTYDRDQIEGTVERCVRSIQQEFQQD
jgi:hypothetical protein